MWEGWGETLGKITNELESFMHPGAIRPEFVWNCDEFRWTKDELHWIKDDFEAKRIIDYIYLQIE